MIRISLLEPAAKFNIHNLVLANPQEFTLSGKHIVRRGVNDGSVTKFFTVGLLCNHIFNPGRGSQVLAALNVYSWPRSAAVVLSIVNDRRLVVPTFLNGVSFSTKVRSSRSGSGSSYHRTPIIASPSKGKEVAKKVLEADDEGKLSFSSVVK